MSKRDDMIREIPGQAYIPMQFLALSLTFFLSPANSQYFTLPTHSLLDICVKYINVEGGGVYV